MVIALGGALEQDLSEAQLEDEVCTEVGDGEIQFFAAKDHTNFVLFLMSFFFLDAIAFIVLVRSTYKRRQADKEPLGEEGLRLEKELEAKTVLHRMGHPHQHQHKSAHDGEAGITTSE